ncbi:MAG: hypothetical protein ABH854_04010 [Candidatus Diapherotrites archaeon]|nr:hypothetical protein [Candidatus Micrarchaeota archaeon]MBU1939275.1 hypothetical protein [Candidatus Micrarchaeota archaeon]
MAYTLVDGHQIDVNLDTSKLDYAKRKDVFDTYLGMRLKEIVYHWAFFATLAAGFYFLAMAVSYGGVYILPLFLCSFAAYKARWMYLKFWSRKNKFGKKTVVRIDGAG